MSYSVKFEDIGLKDYKETWDYQASLFEELKRSKTENGLQGHRSLPKTNSAEYMM